jgi:DNA-binding YbaB/EbfC family protein
MGSGFLKRKKEMKKLQEQLGQMKNDLDNLEVTGESGHGLVTVTLMGDHRMKSIHIKPECVDPKDVEGLQDLIRVAYNEAVNKIDEKTKNMQGGNPMMGGFPF